MAAHTVQRLLDSKNVFIFCRCADKINDNVETFIRVVNHAVFFADSLENIAASPEIRRREDRHNRLKAHGFTAGKIGKLCKECQVERPGKLIDAFIVYIQHFGQEAFGSWVASLEDFQPNGYSALSLFNGFLNLAH